MGTCFMYGNVNSWPLNLISGDPVQTGNTRLNNCWSRSLQKRMIGHFANGVTLVSLR
jgi:hypothetical protein